MEPREAVSETVTLRLFAPLERFPSAALAISGGPDSMALMHLARQWCRLIGRDSASLCAITVDHGLRPEAKDEAAFVAATAKRLGFQHRTLIWDAPKLEAGLQAEARKARYDLMIRYCRENNIACLVTAHTEDDQAETMLMRLRRGSGLDGLAAMAPVSEREGLPLVRPLLGISKERLLAYLHAHALPYVSDPSNENLLFERVSLRRLMKVTAQAGLTPAALARSAARLRRCREAISHYVDEFLGANLSIFPLGNAALSRVALDAAPEEIALRALAHAISLIGGETPAPRLVKLERLLEGRTSPEWEATLGGCLVVASPEEVRLFRELGRVRQKEFTLNPGQPVAWDERFYISLAAESPKPAVIRPLGAKGWASYSKSSQAVVKQEKISRLAALTTPAIWEGETLISVPLLSWVRPARGEASHAGVQVTLLPKLADYLRAR